MLSPDAGPFLVPPRRWAEACGLAAAAVGAVVLAAWVAGVEPVKSLVPGWPTMKANTAVGFLLLGGGLALAARGREAPARACAALAALLGAATLLQHVSGQDYGIDQLLFQDRGAALGAAPGRMSAMTAASFVLLAIPVAWWGRPSFATRVPVLAAAALGLFNLAFFLLDVLPPFPGTRMAANAALGVLLLCAGAAFGDGGGLSRLLLGRTQAASAARRLLLPVLGLPLLFGWIAHRAAVRGVLTAEEQASFALFASLSTTAFLVGLALLRLRREEARRAEADRAGGEARERLQAIFRATPSGLILTRPDGTVADLNPMAERLWGLPRERFLDPSFRMAQLYADPAERAKVVETLQREGRLRGLELRMRRGDGEVRTMLFNSDVMRLGGETLFVAAGQDITELRRAQEALAEAEGQQRAVLDNATDAIVTGDQSATIVGWNRAAERIFGHAAGEAVGRPIAMLLPAQEWAEYQADIAGFMQGRPSRYIGRPREMRALRKDGSEVEVELALAVWTGSRGPMFTGVVRDISARKAAEAATRRARERFQSVFEASPVAIALTKDDGRVVDANPAFCALTGYAREELLAPGFRAPALYEDPEERQRMLLAIRRNGMVRDLELRLRRRDGAARTVLSSVEFVDVGGDTTILGLFQDVTERKRLQEEREARIATEAELERLRRTDEFRAQFINSTAHELGTPLTPLALSLSALRQEPDPASAARHLARMERAVERLRRVVGDMVSAADLQARAIALDRKRLDLARLLRDAVARHQDAAARAGVTLVEPEDSGLAVVADEQRLQLVLGHLLGNAIKFTPPRGRVTVSARRDGDLARVEVRDTGIGLTSRQAEGLWKPYAQAHDKSQRTDSGSGLGLYLAKGIVELHKGEVGVSSPGPGQGSTFWFSLPLAAGHADPPAKRRRPPRPEPGAKPGLDVVEEE